MLHAEEYDRHKSTYRFGIIEVVTWIQELAFSSFREKTVFQDDSQKVYEEAGGIPYEKISKRKKKE